MSNLVKRVKDLVLSADDKLLRKYGFVDTDGELTSEGEDVLLDILLQEHKAKLVEVAKELAAEDKAGK